MAVPDFIPPYTENDHVVDRKGMKNLASEVDKAAFETQNLILTDPKGLVHIGKFLDYGSMNKN